MPISSDYKKFIYPLIFSFPVFIAITVVLIIGNKPFPIFPEPENNLTFYPYTDKPEGGNSTIEAFEKESGKIVFNYTINKGIEFPYAGLIINMHENGTYFDASGYDFFNLEAKTIHPVPVKVLLRFYIDNYTSVKDLWSYGVLEREVQLSPQKEQYRLPLNSFRIPLWWYSKVSIPPPPRMKPDLNRLFAINIDTGNGEHAGRQESLHIKSISLQKQAASVYIPVGSLCVLYAGIFSVYFFRLKRKNRTKENNVILGYRQIALTNHKAEELGKLIDYIKTNYCDPGISVNTIYRQTGINQKKINQLLKERQLGSVKQLLNSIRIEEAKRLLQVTDRQILEIALTVGFSNAVHFNRVFRELVGMNPKEYRSKPKPKT